MKATQFVLLAFLITSLATGCQTSRRGVHTIPIARDYRQLERTDVQEATEKVTEAQRAGAQYYSPYEYFSAVRYLEMAQESASRGDRRGAWDYATLSRDMASAAASKSTLPANPAYATVPEDAAATRAEFERLKGRFNELDRDKAILVAPVLYANAAAALSRAEHELNKPRRWTKAARALATVEPDIDTIWAQDFDKDSIVDMHDGAPWEPEDVDSYQDEDGIPDPDNDQDDILDTNDMAPMEPETRNRWHDHDGVPDEYPSLKPVHFESGSAVLSKEVQAYLQGIVLLLNEWPELKLRAAGHTDNRHTPAFNKELSRKRAQAVEQYVASQGVPAERIAGTFHGDSEPVGDNATAEGRALNRRVSLTFE